MVVVVVVVALALVDVCTYNTCTKLSANVCANKHSDNFTPGTDDLYDLYDLFPITVHDLDL